MEAVLETLTDFEINGLHNHYCLADGHAYQDLHPSFYKIVQSLPELWRSASNKTIPESEQLFNKNYAALIDAPMLERCKENFKICPTASNSIDIVGAVLSHLQIKTIMVEPTFDNLALLIRRRGVQLDSVSDLALFQAAEANDIERAFPELKKYGALVIVHPNNPTGLTLSEDGFKHIVAFCERHKQVLVIDNCFRVYRRNTFSDYSLLINSNVSFVAIEDTGKVWPTQDLKASLLYFSDDLKNLMTEIYNEIYLCVSKVTLEILSAFFKETKKVGVKSIFWDLVDTRRQLLRQAIEGSSLVVTDVSMHSNLPVEWLSCSFGSKNDFLLCRELKQLNLAVLPGRQFYWNSSQNPFHQKNIRISLMKPEPMFLGGITILENYCRNNLAIEENFQEAAGI